MTPLQRSIFILAGFLLCTFTASLIGGVATAASVKTWYAELLKPDWTPPARLFGPVWAALYALMAVVAWRVWHRREQPAAQGLLSLWFAQLALNALWSVVFFGLRQPGLALANIVLLLALLVYFRLRLQRLDKLAANLWTPYVAWVTFATALNASIWHLNR